MKESKVSGARDPRHPNAFRTLSSNAQKQNLLFSRIRNVLCLHTGLMQVTNKSTKLLKNCKFRLIFTCNSSSLKLKYRAGFEIEKRKFSDFEPC